MASKKTAPKKSIPQPTSFLVTNCTFTSNPGEGTVECVALIANAVIENAKALQAAAAMLKPADTMVRFGS